MSDLRGMIEAAFWVMLKRRPGKQELANTESLAPQELIATLLVGDEFAIRLEHLMRNPAKTVLRIPDTAKYVPALQDLIPRVDWSVVAQTRSEALLLHEFLSGIEADVLSAARSRDVQELERRLAEVARVRGGLNLPMHPCYSMTCSPDHVKAFFRLLLGRTPNRNESLEERAEQGIVLALQRLLGSREFANVCDALLYERPLPHAENLDAESWAEVVEQILTLFDLQHSIVDIADQGWRALVLAVLTDRNFIDGFCLDKGVDSELYVQLARLTYEQAASQAKIATAMVAPDLEISFEVVSTVADAGLECSARSTLGEELIVSVKHRSTAAEDENLSYWRVHVEGASIGDQIWLRVGPCDEEPGCWLPMVLRPDAEQVEQDTSRAEWMFSQGRITEGLDILNEMARRGIVTMRTCELGLYFSRLVPGFEMFDSYVGSLAKLPELEAEALKRRLHCVMNYGAVGSEDIDLFRTTLTDRPDLEDAELEALLHLVVTVAKGTDFLDVAEIQIVLNRYGMKAIRDVIRFLFHVFAPFEHIGAFINRVNSIDGKECYALIADLCSENLARTLPVLRYVDTQLLSNGRAVRSLLRMMSDLDQEEQSVPVARRAWWLVRRRFKDQDAAMLRDLLDTIGQIERKYGDLEVASACFLRLIDSNQATSRTLEVFVRVERALIAQDDGRPRKRMVEAAQRLVQRATGKAHGVPSDMNLHELARALMVAEDFDRAKVILASIVERSGPTGQLARDLAFCAEKVGDNATVLETSSHFDTTDELKATVHEVKAKRASGELVEARRLAQNNQQHPELAYEYARNLFFEGDFKEAERVGSELLEGDPDNPDFRMIRAAARYELDRHEEGLNDVAYMSRLPISDVMRWEVDLLGAAFNLKGRRIEQGISSLNSVFAAIGCMPVCSIDSTSPQVYDTLAGSDGSVGPQNDQISYPPLEHGPMVSVVMTAYNAEDHIETSIRSILSQRYRNLELIVVDDLSSDGTVGVVEKIARFDPRLRLIQKTTNDGTYVSKNMGILQSRGEYIALQDSDDWSHPDRLGKSIAYLEKNKDTLGVTTDWFRMTTEGEIIVKAGAQITHVCCISLVFRRKQILEKVGFFDSVRIEADMEFIRRTRRIFGEDAFIRLRWPLLIGRAHDNSLTANSEYGISRTGFTQPRVQYQAAYRSWYRDSIGQDELRIDFPLVERKFNAPAVMLPNKGIEA